MARDERAVRLPVAGVVLDADLTIPPGARGIVLFAHGSGSSRHSSRNRYVAEGMQDSGFATLLMDLLTPEEEQADLRTRSCRFDIGLLAERLVGAVDELVRIQDTAALPVAAFGASTGAAAALRTAAERPQRVAVVVSRGGRPDLAADDLPRVQAPTLLVVGGDDREVLGLNAQAAARLRAEHEIAVVPGASHLFEESGALERVVSLSVAWLHRWMPDADRGPAGQQDGDTRGVGRVRP